MTLNQCNADERHISIFASKSVTRKSLREVTSEARNVPFAVTFAHLWCSVGEAGAADQLQTVTCGCRSVQHKFSDYSNLSHRLVVSAARRLSRRFKLSSERTRVTLSLSDLKSDRSAKVWSSSSGRVSVVGVIECQRKMTRGNFFRGRKQRFDTSGFIKRPDSRC